MKQYTASAIQAAIADLDPRDPTYAAAKASAEQQLRDLSVLDLDQDAAPPYHLRHQKLASFAYKCIKPLPVNTEVCIVEL